MHSKKMLRGHLRRDEQGVLLTCDHGVSGRGESFSAALDDLERSAPGALFLDTAEHLVLASGAWDLAREAVECGRFRPAAKLYLGQGTLPEEQALAAYLRAHPGRVTLAQLQAALLRQENVIPPRLICREGRMHLAN